MMRSALHAILLASLTLFAAGSLTAQNAVSALKGHNSNAPVDVAADRIEIQDRADRALLTGNVDIRQGDLQLKAARVTVAYSRAGSTEIQRLDAAGGVTVTSPSETARSQFAIYDLDRRLITMLGEVRLVRGGSTLNGGRLVIDLNTGRALVDGSAVGGAASRGGRITGRFTVPKRDQ